MSWPAISSATVANVPMSGGANVIASTMVAPRTPIDQSHTGWWSASTMPPPRPRMTASNTRMAAAMTVPNAAACTDPTRRPSAPAIAACAAPASPATNANTMARRVADTACRLPDAAKR